MENRSTWNELFAAAIIAALIPLVMLTSRRDVMGVHVNKGLTTAVAWGMAVVISALNVFLLAQTFGLA